MSSTAENTQNEEISVGLATGRKRKLPTIIIDSREKNGYSFAGYETRVDTLKTGDYSLEGYEDRVAVERKSKEDAYGCVGGGRRRFVECLARLAAYERGAVVIESDLRSFASPPERSRIDQRMAIGSYISWACKYRVPVFWVPWSERSEEKARAWAERITVRFLMAYLKHVAGK